MAILERILEHVESGRVDRWYNPAAFVVMAAAAAWMVARVTIG